MKTVLKLTAATLVAGVAFVVAAGARQPRPAKPVIDVLAMTSVPVGHYLLSLTSGGTGRLVNVEVKDGAGKWVNSSDAQLKGLAGKFEFIGNGVFMVVFSSKDFRFTQWWVFRPDGSATVKEVPDRGEKQRAIPVADESLTPPKEDR